MDSHSIWPEEVIISRVEQQIRKPHIYDLYFNDEFAFSVHEDTVVSLRLLRGSRLDRQGIAEIEREELMNSGYERAIRLIGRRARSRQEISWRLKQHQIDDDIVDRIVQKLSDQGLLNDREFAEMWMEHRIISQKKGRRWAEQELMQKGVAKQDIEHAGGLIDRETEASSARQLARKKWNLTKGEQEVRKQKTAMYLLRRGFPSDIVYEVIRQCMYEDEDLHE